MGRSRPKEKEGSRKAKGRTTMTSPRRNACRRETMAYANDLTVLTPTRAPSRQPLLDLRVVAKERGKARLGPPSPKPKKAPCKFGAKCKLYAN